MAYRHGVWSSGRLWRARYSVKEPSIQQAGRCPAGLEVDGVDHDPVGLSGFACQFAKDTVAPPGDSSG